MKWFRMYHGAPADPKFGSIARRTGASRERVFFVWCMLLDSASDADERGVIETDADAIADTINCETESVEAILADMEARGMIADGRIAKWDERQPKSDKDQTAAARQAKARGKRNAGVTRDAPVTNTEITALDTEVDTERSTLSSLRSDNDAACAARFEPPEDDRDDEPEPPEPFEPVDWDAKLFGDAVALLEGKQEPMRNGREGRIVDKSRARQIAGQLKKSRNGNPWEAWQAILAAKTAADPVQFLLGAIKRPPPEAQPPPQVDWKALEREADERDRLKREARAYAN